MLFKWYLKKTHREKALNFKNMGKKINRMVCILNKNFKIKIITTHGLNFFLILKPVYRKAIQIYKIKLHPITHLTNHIREEYKYIKPASVLKNCLTGGCASEMLPESTIARLLSLSTGIA